MLNSIDRMFEFGGKALALRGYRQQLLASNIANADTPNYKATDINFASELRKAMSGTGGSVALSRTDAGHLSAGSSGSLAGVKPMYRTAVQPSIDGNTVDADIEQAQFSENALQYMTSLQFLNGKIQSVQLALRGN